jgi:hypothetical protein
MNILVAATAIAAAEAVTDTDDVTVEDNLNIGCPEKQDVSHPDGIV